MCILRNEKGGCDESSPSQMDDAYAKFQQWHEKFADNIHDMGGKLGEGKVLTSNGVVDGPFIEVKEMVGGYMLLNAKDIDEAIQVVHECPPVVASLSFTTVEVREIFKP